MTERKPEELVVIGGGQLGSLAALFAARAGYQVTLLEKSPAILSGAATVMARDHSTGMEYPADTETGKTCLHSSMILNTVWKDIGIHSKEPSIWFTTDKEIEAHTTQKVDLPKHYRKMFDAYNVARGIGSKMLAKGSKKLREFGELFKERFFPKHYRADAVPRPLQGKEQYFRRDDVLKGAIQTEERGFDIIRRLSLLEAALQKEADQKHITIKTNCDIGEVKKEGNRFVIYDNKNKKIAEADQVFNAAGEGLNKIKHPCDFNIPLRCEYRKIGLISVDEETKAIPSVFVLSAQHSHFAGMYSRQNDRCALLYLALPPDQTPDNIDDYLKEAADTVFPGLRGAKGLRLFRQPLMLSIGGDLDKRRYLPIAEPMPGYSWGYALKGIYAERMAIEAVERFKRRTANKSDSPLSRWIDKSQDAWDKTLKMALTNGAYSMTNALKGLNVTPQSPEQKQREKKFVEDRPDIDPHLLNDASYAYYRQHHPKAQEPAENFEPDDIWAAFADKLKEARRRRGPPGIG